MTTVHFSEDDKKKIYIHILKMTTGEGSEPQMSVKNLNRLLQKYGTSLEQLAASPDVLLGEGKESQELKEKLETALRANSAFAAQNEAMRKELGKRRERKIKWQKREEKLTPFLSMVNAGAAFLAAGRGNIPEGVFFRAVIGAAIGFFFACGYGMLTGISSGLPLFLGPCFGAIGGAATCGVFTVAKRLTERHKAALNPTLQKRCQKAGLVVGLSAVAGASFLGIQHAEDRLHDHFAAAAKNEAFSYAMGDLKPGMISALDNGVYVDVVAADKKAETNKSNPFFAMHHDEELMTYEEAVSLAQIKSKETGLTYRLPTPAEANLMISTDALYDKKSVFPVKWKTGVFPEGWYMVEGGKMEKLQDRTLIEAPPDMKANVRLVRELKK